MTWIDDFRQRGAQGRGRRKILRTAEEWEEKAAKEKQKAARIAEAKREEYKITVEALLKAVIDAIGGVEIFRALIKKQNNNSTLDPSDSAPDPIAPPQPMPPDREKPAEDLGGKTAVHALLEKLKSNSSGTPMPPDGAKSAVTKGQNIFKKISWRTLSKAISRPILCPQQHSIRPMQ